MRLRHPDGQTVHLAGLLSPEPENELRDLLTRLETYSGDLSCLSLSLSPAFASGLAGSIGMRRRLEMGLSARGLEVVTLRAAFVHHSWRSWWTYLLDLAYILADLLPEDTTHGSISTTVPSLGEDPWESAARELEDLGSGLTEIAWHTGSFIRVACAPQEGTLLADIDDSVRLLSSVDPARIGVCLDPATLAELSETPAQALLKLRRAKLNVVKLRLGGAAGSATQALLGAVLGSAHPLCDHFEAAPAALDEALEEFGILGMAEMEDRPMPGLGRSVA
ncbi:MAG TPA: hypothetical protein DGG94_22155 [Micromonosporaceae bacterium]|nr:hypothetical protein [Micromonosporaceae bacterium]HCU52461.1 hypothetical protein [Micromonosporaceae bacterium]